jgi:hypothetical protein
MFVINKESYEMLKIKQCLMKEIDVSSELATTSRRAIDLEKLDMKKFQRKKSDSEQDEQQKDRKLNAMKGRFSIVH